MNKSKFRLVPDADGSFCLERYNSDAGYWLVERARVKSQEEAEIMIERLTGKVYYYTEEDG